MNPAQTLKSILYKLYTVLAYIISPPQCYACRNFMQQRMTLCPPCNMAIELIAPKMFQVNSSYMLTVYTVSRYTQPLRPMLFAKYRSDEITIEKLADIIWHKSVVSQVHIDYFIPIPLHWTREVKRGFNQSQLIANRLSHHSKIPVLPALQRHKMTDYQVKVESQDRALNVKKSMQATSLCDNITGKHIMMVDDSCTTGATALEAARALAPFKPASINMIVACRAL